jgi:hypothetical protein
MGDEQDEADRLSRGESLKITEEAVRHAISNEGGLIRVETISDEEWLAAVDAESVEA